VISYKIYKSKLGEKFSFFGGYKSFCNLNVAFDVSNDINNFKYVWVGWIDAKDLVPELGGEVKNSRDSKEWNELKRIGLRQKQLLKTIFNKSEIKYSEDHDAQDFYLKTGEDEFTVITRKNLDQDFSQHYNCEYPSSGEISFGIYPLNCNLEKTLDVAKIISDYLTPKMDHANALVKEMVRLEDEKKAIGKNSWLYKAK
jgi:hypothetical protein